MEEQTEVKRGPGRPPKSDKTEPVDWEKRPRRRVDLSGEAELNLKAPARPGFIRRWVDDMHGRIERFRGKDYEPVIDDNGSQISVVVGKHTDGRRAILMETREDWYNEAQQQKATLIPEPKTMKAAQASNGEYIPKVGGKSVSSALNDDKLR